MILGPEYSEAQAGSFPLHGGDLARASEQFGIPVSRWVDLSTGISPWSWPVPEIPEHVWRRLPPRKDGLQAAAAAFYQSPCPLLAVPGSQWAIAQLCPVLFQGREIQAGQRVAVPVRGYQEHRFAWAQVGLSWVEYENIAQLELRVHAGEVDHAVVIDPNNPTGEICGRARLERIAQQLERRKGWLVVDQAFADLEGEPLFDLGPRAVLLRSLGKFFGLAGLRVGFVAAPLPLREALEARLGPWGIAHPARFLAEQALVDRSWQQGQRATVARRSEAWSQWLAQRLGHPVVNAGLFCTLRAATQECERIYWALGRRGVLVRIFEDRAGQNLLRFGLPAQQDPAQWTHWFESV